MAQALAVLAVLILSHHSARQLPTPFAMVLVFQTHLVSMNSVRPQRLRTSQVLLVLQIPKFHSLAFSRSSLLPPQAVAVLLTRQNDLLDEIPGGRRLILTLLPMPLNRIPRNRPPYSRYTTTYLEIISTFVNVVILLHRLAGRIQFGTTSPCMISLSSAPRRLRVPSLHTGVSTPAPQPAHTCGVEPALWRRAI